MLFSALLIVALYLQPALSKPPGRLQPRFFTFLKPLAPAIQWMIALCLCRHVSGQLFSSKLLWGSKENCRWRIHIFQTRVSSCNGSDHKLIGHLSSFHFKSWLKGNSWGLWGIQVTLGLNSCMKDFWQKPKTPLQCSLLLQESETSSQGRGECSWYFSPVETA